MISMTPTQRMASITAKATSTTKAHSTTRIWMPRERARDGETEVSSSWLYIRAQSRTPTGRAMARAARSAGVTVRISPISREEYLANLPPRARISRPAAMEVEEKTEHIREMHDKLILSMATLVESRDNSTGGHIKRTSEGVRILMDEIMRNNRLHVTKEFRKAIIKAAPMHDLGKIAVPDRILQKPGRFEPDEYEIMKTHAAEGGRIVHQILEGTDDEYFRKIAENVANYHHERWDGSGYPEGLAGLDIPLEARIMAIADVYDALVSKRVYKESMSFEAADKIIMEGMGKHFDKRLESYYVAARPRLEAYYRSIAEVEAEGQKTKEPREDGKIAEVGTAEETGKIAEVAKA